jgi:hypothetical protein
METYTLEFIVNIFGQAVIIGFLISCIPMIIGLGIRGVLKIFKL